MLPKNCGARSIGIAICIKKLNQNVSELLKLTCI